MSDPFAVEKKPTVIHHSAFDIYFATRLVEKLQGITIRGLDVQLLPISTDNMVKPGIALDTAPFAPAKFVRHGEETQDVPSTLEIERDFPLNPQTLKNVVYDTHEIVTRSFITSETDAILGAIRKEVELTTSDEILNQIMVTKDGQLKFGESSLDISELLGEMVGHKDNQPLNVVLREVLASSSSFHPETGISPSITNQFKRNNEELANMLFFAWNLYDILNARNRIISMFRYQESGVIGELKGLVEQLSKVTGDSIPIPSDTTTRRLSQDELATLLGGQSVEVPRYSIGQLSRAESERIRDIISDFDRGETAPLVLFLRNQDAYLSHRDKFPRWSQMPFFTYRLQRRQQDFDRQNPQYKDRCDYSCKLAADYSVEPLAISFESGGIGARWKRGAIISHGDYPLGDFESCWQQVLKQSFLADFSRVQGTAFERNVEEPIIIAVSEPFRMRVKIQRFTHNGENYFHYKFSYGNSLSEGTEFDPLK